MNLCKHGRKTKKQIKKTEEKLNDMEIQGNSSKNYCNRKFFRFNKIQVMLNWLLDELNTFT